MLEGREPGDQPAARELRDIYDDLAACADLRPGPQVDDVFRRLVRFVVDEPADRAAALLDHADVRPIVPHLRALCFDGEYQLERAWARRIAEGPRPHDELERFPYVENYRRLGDMERRAVAAVTGDSPRAIEHVAFVGSGPLPFTSFLLADQGAVRVDNLDRDADALELSRRVAAALGVTGLGFRHVDVGSMQDIRDIRDGEDDRDGLGDGDGDGGLARYDLVVLAALVGATPADKARVLDHLAVSMAPGALLLVRSAQGLRTLLYPEVEIDALAGFDVLDVVHPTDEVINSVILARKPEDR